jgi:hypothetical protein
LSAFPEYPNPNFNQIELDLARTFPEEMGSPFHKHFETFGSGGGVRSSNLLTTREPLELVDFY